MFRPIDRLTVASGCSICERLGIGWVAEWRGEEGPKMTATEPIKTDHEQLAILKADHEALCDAVHGMRGDIAMLLQMVRMLRKEPDEVEKFDEVPDEDICGLCGEAGADKIPHPTYWPGEQRPGTDYVHQECEQEECRRAFNSLSSKQRDSFLAEVSRHG